MAQPSDSPDAPACSPRIFPCAGAVHAPFKHFDQHVDAVQERLAGMAGAEGGDKARAPPLYVVCRRGNDSQRAVARLRQLGIAHAVDVVGGMEGWAREVDPGFPTY
jgi:adenylyltransferase/sulfurtransferase